MSSNQNQRPIFFEDQYLSAEDLNAVIDFCRTQQARHALGAHTWGIAAGLQITEKDSSLGGGQVDIYIQPGLAWDGFGRPIVLLTPYKIPAGLFQSIPYDSGNPEGILVQVWLRYYEESASPPPQGFANCNSGGQFSRIQETYRIEIGERINHGDRHGLVSVAGYSLDAQDVLQKFILPLSKIPPDPPIVLYDESIPYQDFTEDNPKKKWLIPLGSVRWQPNAIPSQAGNFLNRSDADKTQSSKQRVYIGVVAGAVQAADGVIRMRDRTKKPYSTVTSSDLVWVEGDLRTEGDVRLFKGKVGFFDANGQDKDVPISIQREDSSEPKTSLQAVIGKDNQGNNSFSVGPLESSPSPKAPSKFLTKFTVLDNGKVGIGTTTPNNLLTLTGSGGTYLNVKDSDGKFEVLLGADGSGGIVSTMTNHDLQLRSGGNNTRVVIKADGKVSIGPPIPPTGQLTINGNGQGTLTFFSKDADIGYDGGTDKLFVIKDTGNITAFLGNKIGIGTTDPGYKLDIADRVRIREGAAGTAGLWFFQTGPNADRAFVGMASDNHVGFFGNNGAAWGLVMNVSNGNVGIGTSTTGAKLEVGGTVNCSGAMSVGGAMQVSGAMGVSGAMHVSGAMKVDGAFTVSGTKSFAIPHPLHSEELRLVHSCLEGPENGVFYRGMGRLQNGRATIRLPDYFEALTRPDRRTVLLTPKFEADEPIASLAASEVKNGQFSVRAADDRNPNQTFDWEVKAVRADLDELSVEVPKGSLENPPR
jgi:hypothetical protein